MSNIRSAVFLLWLVASPAAASAKDARPAAPTCIFLFSQISCFDFADGQRAGPFDLTKFRDLEACEFDGRPPIGSDPRALFDKIDANHDGILTRDEVAAFIEKGVQSCRTAPAPPQPNPS
jgi:hypothetical protein